MPEQNNKPEDYPSGPRHRPTGSQVMDSIVSKSNCEFLSLACKPNCPHLKTLLTYGTTSAVNRDEVDRLRKRFLKLDRVSPRNLTPHSAPRRDTNLATMRKYSHEVR